MGIASTATENKVTITVKENGANASTTGYSISLSTNATSDTATFTGTTSGATIEFNNIVTGITYYIWAGKSSNATGTRIYTGQSVVVSDNSPTAVTAQYYTLTLIKGTGISAVSGAGSYLYNSSNVQAIAIDATVSNGYTWSTWTKTSGTNPSTFTAGKHYPIGG